MDGMQIPGVDEIKTLLLYVISLHIDIQLEVSFHKIQDFHLVMPVDVYSFPVCDLEDFIEAAGERGLCRGLSAPSDPYQSCPVISYAPRLSRACL